MAELTDEDRAAAREAYVAWLTSPEPPHEEWLAMWIAGLRAGREQQREEDARICERRTTDLHGLEDKAYNRALKWCAAAIRKSAEPPKGEPTAKPIGE